MPPAHRFRFDEFLLDVPNRRLLRAGQPVELSSRYFDALVLMVRAQGALVGKQRFFDEVWAGMVVTDAALTQCIKDVRRALGDDAGNPRFVRTVPGHGYRFVAAVQGVEEGTAAPEAAALTSSSPAAAAQPLDPASPAAAAPGQPPPVAPLERPLAPRPERIHRFLADGIGGTLGGGLAGIFVGLIYGSALAHTQAGQGIGTSTVLLVLIAVTVVAGLAGGFGVAFGIAAGRQAGSNPAWTVAGAACSGFVVGGLLKLLGSDAFNLLLGHAPGGITGAIEGAVMGMAVAGGAMLAGSLDAPVRWRPVVGAAIAGGVAGALLTWGGGRLMGGSLERLAGAFASSRLDLSPLGRLFGEANFGTTTQVALGAVEGLLFGACVAAAIVLAQRLAR